MSEETDDIDMEAHLAEAQAALPRRFDAGAADGSDARVLEQVVIRGKDGQDVYAYLAIKPARYLDYVRALAGDDEIDFEAYGEVLASGPGAVPPAEVQRAMAENYGFQGNKFNLNV